MKIFRGLLINNIAGGFSPDKAINLYSYFSHANTIMLKVTNKKYTKASNIIPIYYIKEGTHIPRHIHNLKAKIVSEI